MVAGRKVDKDLMRTSNMKLVLSVIRSAGEISKAQVAEATGMSIVSVGRIADELAELGLVLEREKEPEPGSVGRPPKALVLNTEGLRSCSAYLEESALRLALVDAYGGLYHAETHPIPPEVTFTPEEVLPWLAGRLECYLSAHEAGEVLPTVGVVVPGIVDVSKGELQFSANWKWQQVHIVDYLTAHLPGYQFVLENDTKAMALAEHAFGAAAGCNNLVLLNLGEGIGAAVILEGEVYRGKDNMAGEIGHVILNPAGKICECGQVGCLQTNLARRAILNEARSVYHQVDMSGLFACFQRGEPFAVALIQQVVDYISIAINLLANTYGPEVVLLCGSTLRESPALCHLVADHYRSKLNDYMKDAFELRFESFGADGHLIGGGALAFWKVLDMLLGGKRVGVCSA